VTDWHPIPTKEQTVKVIRYEAHIRATALAARDTYTYRQGIVVEARNINTGFRQAARLATANLPAHHEIISLNFGAVES